MAKYVTYKDQSIAIGDTVRVSQSIADGDKTRTQIFEGIVIAIKNAGTGKSVTVRKVATGNVGVERILPLNLPSIQNIEVKRKGAVRRSKLYFLRERVGKAATKIREKTVHHRSAA